jgi:hypothetical protein
VNIELFIRRFMGETFDPKVEGKEAFGRGGKVG